MHPVLRPILFSLAASLAASPVSAQSVGDINISPKRVVFDATTSTATVYIFNRGTSPSLYQIALVDRAMAYNGQIKAVSEMAGEPGEAQVAARLKPASGMIQYTPRRVTIAPGGSQTIRLRALRPAGLADGEYRTSLTVSAMPPEDLGLTAEKAADLGGQELSLRVASLFEVSIPVILRQGPHPVSASLLSAEIKGANLRMVIGREGTGSVYGNVEIHRDSPRGPLLSESKGIGVYEEIDHRDLEIPLPEAAKTPARLFVVYRDDDGEPGKVLASKEIIRQ